MVETSPKCCVEHMTLRAVNFTGTSVSGRYGSKKSFSYHYQCKHCGKTKIKEIKE